MTADSILRKLDDWFCDVMIPNAPMPMNAHQEIADLRLTIFRGSRQWAMFFETVAYNTQADGFEHDIFLFGNSLRCEGWLLEDGDCPITWPGDKPPSVEENGKVFSRLDRAGFSLEIHGQVMNFKPTAQEYSDARVTFRHNRTGFGSIGHTQILRFVCHTLDHPFFASQETLLALLDQYQTPRVRPLSQSMSLFLQTREYHHPDFGDFEPRPSEIPALQVLARAVASGDLSEWHALDPSSFNSHWQFWAAQRRKLYGDSGGDMISDDWDDEARLYWEERDRAWQDDLEKLPPHIRAGVEEAMREHSEMLAQMPTETTGFCVMHVMNIYDGERAWSITPYTSVTEFVPDLQEHDSDLKEFPAEETP